MSGARVLLVTLTNDVGADRIVSELGRQGAACAVLGPPANYPSLSRFVVRRFDMSKRFGTWVATWRFGQYLAAAVNAWQPDRIVPLDELASLLLRTQAKAPGTDTRVQAVLHRSFGDPAGYHAACHRLALMKVAAAAGVRCPPFGSDADTVAAPLVVKRDHSSGSGGVTVVPDERSLPRALRKAAVLRAIKRLMARVAGYDHGPDPILIQQFVPGTLAMHTVVADRGRVVDGVSFRAVQSHPEKRASTILEPLDCPEMDEAVKNVVASLGCSGFVSFDFILDPDGAAHLIEMNPRPIGSTHLGRLVGHDLALAFLSGSPADVTQPPTVGSMALFPKELERDPTGALLDAEVGPRHDVPWNEPRLVEAYSAYLQRLHPAQAATIRNRLGGGVRQGRADAPPASARLSGASS